MSQENAPASPTVAMFQKAHTKLIALQRVEEQFNTLAAQRRKLQDELRSIQGEINGEFDRLIDASDPAPRVQLQIADSISKRDNGRMRLEAETA